MHIADVSRSRRPAWLLGGAVFRVMLVLAAACLAFGWMAWPSLQGKTEAPRQAVAAAGQGSAPQAPAKLQASLSAPEPGPSQTPPASVAAAPPAPVAVAAPVAVTAVSSSSAAPAPRPAQVPQAQVQPAPQAQQTSQGPLTIHFPRATQGSQPPQGSQGSQPSRPPFIVEAARSGDVRAAERAPAPSAAPEAVRSLGPARTPPAPPPTAAQAPATVASAAAPAPQPPSGAIDLNTASIEQLNALQGAGSVGRAIIRGRPYASAEDLVTKKILRRSVYEQIKDQVTVR